jgi:hypothetical protein
MKPEVLTTVRNWTAGCVLVVGLIYSVAAITVNATPAYAASCNCNEEYQEAEVFCSSFGGIATFQCPLTAPNGTLYFLATCNNPDVAIAEPCSGT